MQKVMVLGCCGAGKSTFARQLHSITELELVHLDQYYWKANWQETPKHEWENIVQHLAQKSHWIIDGNYSSTIDIRIQEADTIIYLDYPTWKCLWRVLRRIYKYRGIVRPDMPQGCNERFDWEFIHYVATFNLTRRKYILQKLKKAQKDKKNIKILTTDKEVNQYLDNIQHYFSAAS